jgi:hypothetical protein
VNFVQQKKFVAAGIVLLVTAGVVILFALPRLPLAARIGLASFDFVLAALLFAALRQKRR